MGLFVPLFKEKMPFGFLLMYLQLCRSCLLGRTENDLTFITITRPVPQTEIEKVRFLFQRGAATITFAKIFALVTYEGTTCAYSEGTVGNEENILE